MSLAKREWILLLLKYSPLDRIHIEECMLDKRIFLVMFAFVMLGCGLFESENAAENDIVETLNTEITFGPSDPSNSIVARFEFTCNKHDCKYQCTLDSDIWQDCVSPVTYTHLKDGLHTFSVRAIDSEGNIDSTPAVYTWRIDTSRECPMQIIFFDGMENGTDNWIADAPWGLVSPGYLSNYAWADSPDGDYSPNIDRSLVSRMIRIPVDLCWRDRTELRLSFVHKLFLASGDEVYVQVSKNGVDWYTVWYGFWGYNSNDWAEQNVVLWNLLPGSAFYIRFRIFSNDDSDVSDGWYIDNVKVYTIY